MAGLMVLNLDLKISILWSLFFDVFGFLLTYGVRHGI